MTRDEDPSPLRHHDADPEAPAGGAPHPAPSQGGAGFSIDATSLIRDGRRWFPVSGEYHFSRDAPERWEHELRKIKAGGVDLVATYVIWILHEERRGERRWDAHLDVRRFVETAQAVGLEVVLRIGPWAHGEARNGGFPDWLQRLPLAHRTNDPGYLALARDWYADIAGQLEGLFRDDDHPTAPIVAVQVDNELYDQPEHLATLRELAESLGIRAPFWTATGWGAAQVPLDALIPVYGGYSDGFWDESDVELPHFAKTHFAFSDVRDDLSVGADVRTAGPTSGVDDRRYPFLTCELGGGMAVAYHRRPLVEPADIAALALTKLGSGSAWQGYYVYHGTTQPTGELTGMQESQESGYPNDLPVKDYDFYAPIGAAGSIRPHYHLLRMQHLFLKRWAPELLELPTEFPDPGAVGLSTSLRLTDGTGFVFANNHLPGAVPRPDAEGFQFRLPGGIALPSDPVTVPSGAYFVWPVNQPYGDVVALTGTVQPITQIETDAGPVVLFGAIEGIEVELHIDAGDHEIVGARRVDTADGPRWIPSAPPGPACVITVGTTRLVILDPASARSVWSGTVNGCAVIALWDGGLTFRDDGLVLERWSAQEHILTLAPSAGETADAGPFRRHALPATIPSRAADVREVSSATASPATRRGGAAGRLSAPREDEWAGAAVFEVTVPASADFDGAQVLSIDWLGDVARAYVGEQLVSDQFWHGRPWEIDVTRLPRTEPLRIRILPWNGEADWFVDRRVRSRRAQGRADILEATLLTASHHSLTLPGS